MAPFCHPKITKIQKKNSKDALQNRPMLASSSASSWFHFGANLDPLCHPKTAKILKKTIPKMHQKKDRCLHRVFSHLGSILGAKLGPNFGQNGGTLWEATLFFGALFCFSYFFAILTPREGGTPSDRLHVGRFLAPCWHHVGSIIASMGAMCARFWRALVPRFSTCL